MDKKKIEERLLGLTDSIEEVLESTASVKGNVFASAVTMHFEISQLMEFIGRLSSIAKDDMREYADALAESCLSVVSSVAMRSCEDLSDEEIEESLALANKLYERRNAAAKEIEKELRDADQ